MSVKYTYSVADDFPNGKVDIDRLAEEIRDSTIAVALDYITVAGDDCDIWFKAAITAAEKTVLDSIVANHSGLPIEDEEATPVIENKSGVGGYYQCRGVQWDIPASSKVAVEVDWPFPVRLCVLHCDPTNDGDKGFAELGAGTVIGTLGANVSIGDTVFTVSSTVASNLQVGYMLTLDDTTNSEEFRVVAIDKSAGTVTVETAATKAFVAATPTYCKMAIRMTYEEIEFKAGVRQSCGESFLGGPLVPAGMKLRIAYTNANPSQSCRARIKLEYWY